MKNRIQQALTRASKNVEGLSAAELEELSQEAFEYANRPEIIHLPIEWRAYCRNTIAFTLFTGILCTFAVYSPGIRVFVGVVFGAWLGQMSNWLWATLVRNQDHAENRYGAMKDYLGENKEVNLPMDPPILTSEAGKI